MTTVNQLSSHHLHLFRPLDWRARRVEEILAGPNREPSRYNDDKLVWHYFRFRQDLQRDQRGNKRRQLYLVYPELWGAEQLHQDRSDILTALIEGRILAGESDTDIANDAATFPAIIATYEELFFNVRDRLADRDWIVAQALYRERQCDRPPTAPYRLLMRTAGYLGGSAAIDNLLGLSSRTDRDGHHAQNWADGAIGRALRLKGLLAAMQLDPTGESGLALCAQVLRVLEQDRREHWAQVNDGQAVGSDYELMIREVLSTVHLTTGASPSYGLPPDVEKRVHDSPVELRPHHRMQLRRDPHSNLLDELERNVTLPPVQGQESGAAAVTESADGG